MLLAGTVFAVPMSLLAAFAPSDEVLFVARLLGGLSAGMAYPTTLALISALWTGAGRTRAIALWSGTGGAIAALGPLSAGLLLDYFWWGSVFLLTLPLAVIAIVMAGVLVPAHVNEATGSVDNRGGILSVVLAGSLILSINFAPVPNAGTLTLVLAGVALVLFVVRQRRAQPAVRPARRGPPALLGGRLRRCDRLRLPDGRHVRRPAVPAGRARLLDLRRRPDHPPGRDHDGAGGAVLTAGYAAAAGAQISASGASITSSVQNELTKSFASAADTAQQYPDQADQLVSAAKTAFLQGDQWAYLAGIIAVLLGALLVFARFPKRDEERRLLAEYHAADAPQVEGAGATDEPVTG